MKTQVKEHKRQGRTVEAHNRWIPTQDFVIEELDPMPSFRLPSVGQTSDFAVFAATDTERIICGYTDELVSSFDPSVTTTIPAFFSNLEAAQECADYFQEALFS